LLFCDGSTDLTDSADFLSKLFYFTPFHHYNLKISASIYARPDTPLPDLIRELDEHGIDMYHVDCNDDPRVFDDIRNIRKIGDKPVDLHIISSQPERYFSLLENTPVEYLTFQYENLNSPLVVPDTIDAKLGLAITSDTDISVFEAYKNRFDFILIMATTPGQSGGSFNTDNFKKIRAFSRHFPDKKIHVDGGVNAEISFILRNMGVSSVVSGSFLFKSDYLGAAMLNLKGENFDSTYSVHDFMLTNGEAPILQGNEHNFLDILQAIENYKLGFVIMADAQMQLKGIITNADIRRGLIRHINNLNDISVQEIINSQPFTLQENLSINDMLKSIKAQGFPINYAPVVDDNNVVKGAVTFFNLIKGE